MHSMLGASRNSLLLERLARRLGWGARPKMLDIGGGHGFLGLEMAAKDWYVTVLDHDPAKTELLGPWLARRSPRRLSIDFLTLAMEEIPGARFASRLCALQSITFFGALLFAPRDRVGAILRTCWERLAPGGALLIHELVRQDPAEHLYKHRFDRDELFDVIAGNVAPPSLVSILDGEPMEEFRSGLSVLLACRRSGAG
jgi:SAM-dependent methyltransferase